MQDKLRNWDHSSLLRWVRERRSIDRFELARRLEVNERTIRNLEANLVLPSSKTRAKLREWLAIEPDHWHAYHAALELEDERRQDTELARNWLSVWGPPTERRFPGGCILQLRLPPCEMLDEDDAQFRLAVLTTRYQAQIIDVISQEEPHGAVLCRAADRQLQSLQEQLRCQVFDSARELTKLAPYLLLRRPQPLFDGTVNLDRAAVGRQTEVDFYPAIATLSAILDGDLPTMGACLERIDLRRNETWVFDYETPSRHPPSADNLRGQRRPLSGDLEILVGRGRALVVRDVATNLTGAGFVVDYLLGARCAVMIALDEAGGVVTGAGEAFYALTVYSTRGDWLDAPIAREGLRRIEEQIAVALAGPARLILDDLETSAQSDPSPETAWTSRLWIGSEVQNLEIPVALAQSGVVALTASVEPTNRTAYQTWLLSVDMAAHARAVHRTFREQSRFAAVASQRFDEYADRVWGEIIARAGPSRDWGSILSASMVGRGSEALFVHDTGRQLGQIALIIGYGESNGPPELPAQVQEIPSLLWGLVEELPQVPHLLRDTVATVLEHVFAGPRDASARHLRRDSIVQALRWFDPSFGAQAKQATEARLRSLDRAVAALREAKGPMYAALWRFGPTLPLGVRRGGAHDLWVDRELHHEVRADLESGRLVSNLRALAWRLDPNSPNKVYRLRGTDAALLEGDRVTTSKSHLRPGAALETMGDLLISLRREGSRIMVELAQYALSREDEASLGVKSLKVLARYSFWRRRQGAEPFGFWILDRDRYFDAVVRPAHQYVPPLPARRARLPKGASTLRRNLVLEDHLLPGGRPVVTAGRRVLVAPGEAPGRGGRPDGIGPWIEEQLAFFLGAGHSSDTDFWPFPSHWALCPRARLSIAGGTGQPRAIGAAFLGQPAQRVGGQVHDGGGLRRPDDGVAFESANVDSAVDLALEHVRRAALRSAGPCEDL